MFKKKIKKQVSPSIFKHIKNIEELLGITCPELQAVDVLYEKKGLILGQINLDIEELKDASGYHGGYYIAEKNFLIYTRKIPNPSSLILEFSDTTEAEQLFFIAHELRHVWQYNYHYDRYYAKNAINLECLDDAAEIDADAFALAYIFSSKTDYSISDLPSLIREIIFTSRVDEGKRLAKAEEINKEFNLGDWAKILHLRPTIKKNSMLPELNTFNQIPK